MSWLSKTFGLSPAGVNWPRAVLFLDVALVPLVVFAAIGHQQYLLSALFGVLFAWLADPGGSYGQRVSRIAIFELIGAGLTALGFGIGKQAWGWLVPDYSPNAPPNGRHSQPLNPLDHVRLRPTALDRPGSPAPQAHSRPGRAVSTGRRSTAAPGSHSPRPHAARVRRPAFQPSIEMPIRPAVSLRS